jgi:hypothetical protein
MTDQLAVAQYAGEIVSGDVSGGPNTSHTIVVGALAALLDAVPPGATQADTSTPRSTGTCWQSKPKAQPPYTRRESVRSLPGPHRAPAGGRRQAARQPALPRRRLQPGFLPFLYGDDGALVLFTRGLLIAG